MGLKMQSLFERMADAYPGTLRADKLREEYALIVATDERGTETSFELFPSECVDSTGAAVTLVRVQSGDSAHPVLVTPIPSAVLAVALR